MKSYANGGTVKPGGERLVGDIGPRMQMNQDYQRNDWINRCLPKDQSAHTVIGNMIGAWLGRIINGAMYTLGAVVVLKTFGII